MRYNRARKTILLLCVSLAALVFTGVILEIALRCLSHYGRIQVSLEPVRFNRIDTICEYDSDLGWRNRSNVDTVKGYYFGNVLKTVKEKTNSRGLRSPECSLNKPGGTFRVLCLGCSRTYGYGVTMEEAYPYFLDELLSETLRQPVEVLNCGVNGYGLDQMALRFEKYATDFQPDLVILQMYKPSIERIQYDRNWQTPKPVFKLRGDELSLENVPVPKKWCPAVQDWTMRHSYLFAFIQKRLLEIAEVRRMKGGVDIKTDKNLHRLATQILARLKRQTDSIGVPLIVFIWTDRNWLMPIATGAGVTTIDLRDYENISSWNEMGPLDNPPPVGHWSTNGNRFVATALRNYIVKSGLAGAKDGGSEQLQ